MTESKTNVDKKVEIRFDDKLTVRCDSETKKALKQFSKETGISECQIIHALLTAYLCGMQQKSQYVDKSPTINLSIERSVQRVRRYTSEGVEVRRGTPEEMGMNYFQADSGIWTRQDVPASELNINGHVGGCGCLLCRKIGMREANTTKQPVREEERRNHEMSYLRKRNI